ncbi:MAG: 4a-hydroxytetrahydrobiopterin dehydratase [Polyangiaceae bacterium]|nr:4a-hydroxytetrahydrobiopterin dehydratase [Polyangiaceae bacterium]
MTETTELKKRRCVPCEGGLDKLDAVAVSRNLSMLQGWSHVQSKLMKVYEFKDFVAAMRFVNHMADKAESHGHHPDFAVHYNQVTVTIWTHAIGGLSENDFILAAVIDDYAR